MRIDLTEKVALVTGAATGIGKACALALARAGATVVAVDIDENGIADSIGEIGSGIAIACDICVPSAVDELGKTIASRFGGIDILVNCAGLIFYQTSVEDVSVDEWDRVLNTNLRGTFLLCRTFMNSLKSRRDGRIINFSSLAARMGGIDVGVHYTASKAGLIGLTRSLAKEGGAYGITANALAPGLILTDPVRRQIGEKVEEYEREIPLGRLGESEDIANAVVFLASSQASYITGVILDINGGRYVA